MIQLFVGSKRVDLFKDENIEIQDSIQDAKDIGKIFTTFSRTFTVPANKNNNNVFQNFYNFDVVNGFDPREKVSSVITKNGATYRKGFIQIRKVKLKNNKPTSYTIFFTGLLSTLKDELQDDRLSNLIELDNYNHKYTQENVERGFRSYLSINSDGTVQEESLPQNADLSYPFISVQDRYAVNGSGKVRAVDENNNFSGKLDYQDLKPAIRCVRIIEAIESQYDITFSNDFLKDHFQFKNLSLWLNRNKGRLGTEQIYDEVLFNTDYGTPTSGINIISTDEIDVFSETNNGQVFNLQEYSYNFSITATGTAEAVFTFIDVNNNNEILEESVFNFDNNANVFNFNISLSPDGFNFQRTYKPYLKIETTEPGISNLDIELTVTKEGLTNGSQFFNEGIYNKSISSINDVKITSQIPKLKIIDFLTSIFKMYNLTAEVVDDVIEVQPLDDYYNQGKEVDITQYVDITDSTVSKVDTIKRFNFKHEEAETLLLKKGNELRDSEYGNLKKELPKEPNTVLGGQELDIQTKFHKILYERLRQNDGTISNILFGWYVDDNQEQLSNQPILLYPESNLTNDAIQFKSAFFTNDPQTYIAPNNATSSKTTNFSRELSEFDSLTEEGLFDLFYSKYVSRVFSPQSRKVELDAVLRDDFILNYRLNDIIIYKNRRHLINDIKINLNTNKARLTLLNVPVEVINFNANNDKAESLGLSINSVNVSGSTSTKDFDIVSDGVWSVLIDESWLTAKPDRGSKNETVQLTIQDNNSGARRTAKVIVNTANLSQTINVTQDIK